jgi:hypothetical protein
MAYCEICEVHMQQRSYKRHLTSKKHQEAEREEVAERRMAEMEAEHERMMVEVVEKEAEYERLRE